MKVDCRARRLGIVALSFTVLGAAAGALSANPAIAAGIVREVTTVSCSVTGTNWCISGANASSGIGVIGTSKSGSGVVATSTSQYGLKATSSSGTAIFAQTTSGPSAVSATAGSGTAIVANTTSGISAISATNTNGNGVNASGNPYGIVGSSTSTSVGVGMYGITSGDNGYGIIGRADGTSGIGTVGEAGAGIGLVGSADNGIGVEGNSNLNYAGYFNSGSGYGVFANSQSNVALVGRTANGNASDIQGSNIGLLGRSPAAGYPLVLTDATPNTLFQVDGHGNVSYTGSLTHVGSISGGGKARSFSAVATRPTVEDSGTAQLVSGVAVVRLDPTFAASIDLSTAYRIFLTPAGDTRGLYVANRTAAGFVVRESQAGHSTVAFDYRILATALGQSGQRMARINSITDTSLVKAPLPAMPAAATIPRPRPIPTLPTVKP